MTLADQLARRLVDALAAAADVEPVTDDEWNAPHPDGVAARESFTTAALAVLTEWLHAPATIAAVARSIGDATEDQRDPAEAVSARLIAELHATGATP